MEWQTCLNFFVDLEFVPNFKCRRRYYLVLWFNEPLGDKNLSFANTVIVNSYLSRIFCQANFYTLSLRIGAKIII